MLQPVCAALLALLCINAGAQHNIGYVLKNDVPVVHGTDTLTMAWVGGMNNPQFVAIDLDSALDGEADLMVYDRDDGSLHAFKFSNGTYSWLPYAHRQLPTIAKHGFCVGRDYNGDGRTDLMTNTHVVNEARILLNVSETEPAFSEVVSKLKYRHGNAQVTLYVINNSIPEWTDLDGDTDLDLLFYANNIAGMDCPGLVVIESQSVDDFGSLDSLAFSVGNRCWGKFTPGFDGVFGLWKSFSCDTTCNPNDGQRHNIQPTIATADLNGDDELDVLMGLTHNPHLRAFINGATTANAAMNLSLTDTNFPSAGVPINLPSQPNAFWIDVDHDGLNDIVVGAGQLTQASIDRDTSITTLVDRYYRNTGSATAPQFTAQSSGLFNHQMIDIGTRSTPVLADLNADSLPDLVVGSVGKNFFTGLATARLAVYINQGTTGYPIFTLATENLGASFGTAMLNPAAADMDGDGLADLIAGDEHGDLHLFRNLGGVPFPQFELADSAFESIHVSAEAHPFATDHNGDYLPDLVVGDKQGRIHYFENDGTATEPDFDGSPTISQLGGVNTSAWGGGAAPVFSNAIDSANSLYCVVGTASGTALVYGPITNVFETYPLADSIVTEATHAAPALANLSGDQRHELIIGQNNGGLYYLRRLKDIPVGEFEQDQQPTRWTISPNPAAIEVRIVLQSSSKGNGTIALHSVGGQLLHSESIINHAGGSVETILQLTHLPHGVYLVKCTFGGTTQCLKLVH